MALPQALNGEFLAVLQSPSAAKLITAFSTSVTVTVSSETTPTTDIADLGIEDTLAVGISALNAFLQANVTGPVLENGETFNALFTGIKSKHLCNHLEVDGVAPYQYAPFLALFSLARYAILTVVPQFNDAKSTYIIGKHKVNISWWTMRVLVWHYKLLAQPNLGSRSGFARTAQWTDVPELVNAVISSVEAVRSQVIGNESWDRLQTAELALEISNSYLMLGMDDQAREALKEATVLSGLKYALSGALGKKTKFQINETSQLVVLAKSATAAEPEAKDEVEARPEALALNDDTLLESINFTKTEMSTETASELEALIPDQQPQLTALDEAILLTDATIRDTFSPQDGLTSEEVLPYAVRVIADKSVNWQVYTQALLARSRIEVHRSRTVERGILQMQAVVDQIVVDTTQVKSIPEPATEETKPSTVPFLAINDEVEPEAPKPTSFFPAIKNEHSAPVMTRLRYVNSLLTPPRWHLESELAYSWASVGSLISALEIFKRLRMWAEVALCLSSADRSNDEDGRGSSGDFKARGIVRWRLFERTDGNKAYKPLDVSHLNPNEFLGPQKPNDDLPSDAPRLFCILGDLEQNAAHYETAWEVSKCRYSRAMKNLGEHYIQQKNLEAARNAYKKAVHVNRLSPELWSRLGDLNLRLNDFEGAAEAYTRAIGAANDDVGGEDARTWSNLGSALWSLYQEAITHIAEHKDEPKATKPEVADDEEDDDAVENYDEYNKAAKLLQQAMNAFKRGSKLSQDNWRIWDNIITIGARIRPPAIADIVMGVQRIAEIRANEETLDYVVIKLLIDDGLLAKEYTGQFVDGLYVLPRGTTEKSIYELLEKKVVPLITQRDDLWALVARARTWRRDYAGAIEASEAAWRCATGTASSSGSLAAAASTPTVQRKDWTKDEKAWENVVVRTDELVSLLENYGENVEGIGSKWKFRARNAVRSVLGKAKEQWEGTEGWKTLQRLMNGLKANKD